MDDFKEMLNELNIDLKELNIYIESDKFKKEAGPVVDDNNKNYKVLPSNVEGKGIFDTKGFSKGDFIGYGKLNNTNTR